jgi:hypothetical protein
MTMNRTIERMNLRPISVFRDGLYASAARTDAKALENHANANGNVKNYEE